ncbi:MAG: deoxyribodipyrimidine photo-lyase [Thalassovita sp.]|nr:deoxyribodipyrimidine photo-lyase [Thalassovita sp.]
MARDQKNDTHPVIVWIRRDFRLSDNPALAAANRTGRPVIPVFIADETFDRLGAAPEWRLKLGLLHFLDRLRQAGSGLVYRQGHALTVLEELVAETGAVGVYWNRAYHPDEIERDRKVKRELKAQSLDAKSFPGNLIFEPWEVTTGTGGFYRVFTPFWKNVRQVQATPPCAAPSRLSAPVAWPRSDDLANWAARHRMARGAEIVRPHLLRGEQAAQERLETFCDTQLRNYSKDRDFPARPATSGLSEPLAYGEISPRQIWFHVMRLWQAGVTGTDTFLKELVWREFAYHLMFHTPRMLTRNWREEWDAFPWNKDDKHPHVISWKRGRTGMAFVDAAMREMYVTGRMHNRGRMIVASYLTKHLMTDWRIGQRWFENCLTDWDPASNAMGWQWAAGSGPDAAPYFRVFNPETQLNKFDPGGDYSNAWIAEGRRHARDTARCYFRAIPCSWSMSVEDAYLSPIVSPQEGRERALSAYHNRSF